MERHGTQRKSRRIAARMKARRKSGRLSVGDALGVTPTHHRARNLAIANAAASSRAAAANYMSNMGHERTRKTKIKRRPKSTPGPSRKNLDTTQSPGSTSSRTLFTVGPYLWSDRTLNKVRHVYGLTGGFNNVRLQYMKSDWCII